MSLAISWDWILHADELLFFIWLVVWAINWLIGLVVRAPKQ